MCGWVCASAQTAVNVAVHAVHAAIERTLKSSLTRTDTYTCVLTHTHTHTLCCMLLHMLRARVHHMLQMEAGKALDIVRTEADVLQLVADVHCIIAAMMGSSTEVGWSARGAAVQAGLQSVGARRANARVRPGCFSSARWW